MLSNCGAGEDSWDPLDIKLVNLKGNQPWIFTWREEPTHWKTSWCWQRLKAGGEGDDRGWDCWTASLTWWTWVWVNSGSWWSTGRPGMLQVMGLERVRHNWVTELNSTEWISKVELMIVWTFLKGKICYMKIGLNKEIMVWLQNCSFNSFHIPLLCQA